MGWLGIVLSVVAAWLLRDDGWLWLLAAAVALLEVWSYGSMRRHAGESAKKRLDYRGGFYNFNDRACDAVPNWLTVVNMAGFVAAECCVVTERLKAKRGVFEDVGGAFSERCCQGNR